MKLCIVFSRSFSYVYPTGWSARHNAAESDKLSADNAAPLLPFVDTLNGKIWERTKTAEHLYHVANPETPAYKVTTL